MSHANIKIWVNSPQNSGDTEAQTYTNYNGLTLLEVKRAFGNECVLAPELGNFPHIGGNNKPVRIAGINGTRSEDNAGMDISVVIERYKNWCSS
jgi:hypothetical protein